MAPLDGHVPLLEGSEDPPLGLLGQSRPRIPHGEGAVQVTRWIGGLPDLQGQHDLPLVGELHRVADQIAQHLTQAQGVAHQGGGRGAGLLHPEAQPLGAGLRQVGPMHRGQQVPAVEGFPGHAQVAGLDAGQVQQVVQQAGQQVSVAGDDLHRLALFGAQAGSLEQLDAAQHTVQGGADFMAHDGQEAALGLVRPARLLLGRLALRHLLLQAGPQGEVPALDAVPGRPEGDPDAVGEQEVEGLEAHLGSARPFSGRKVAQEDHGAEERRGQAQAQGKGQHHVDAEHEEDDEGEVLGVGRALDQGQQVVLHHLGHRDQGDPRVQEGLGHSQGPPRLGQCP